MNGRDVDVFVTHVGLSDEEKANAIKTLIPLVKICENPTIVMGDFNMKQDNPTMQPLLATLEDSFQYYPNQDDYTWPCDPELLKATPDKCERIDYILFSKHFKVESVEIPALQLSDHKPYIAYVDLLDK
jgi:endonuclease/exonuclease/phosphatase family metal-dependent hydrolase